MPHRKAPPASNSSRTAAKIAVAILVVIAVAGFVLVGLSSRTAEPEQDAGSDATQQGASSPTAAEADAGGANAVLFAPGSHLLSASAAAKLKGIAETAREQKRIVAIQARFEMGSEGAERMALARKRTIAVRQVFEDNGIAVRNLQMEISQVPAGGLAGRDANRVEVALR